MASKERAESSASGGALFKEGIPQKKVFADLWMNKHELPPQRGRQLEAAEEGGTLVGRLAARMASRDMIDELNLGPKGRSSEAKQAQVADDKVPTKMKIEGPAISTGTKIEHEHKNTVEKLRKNPSVKNEEVYKDIAMDHLKEHSKYYDEKKGLPAMEKKLQETADNTIPSKMMIGAGLHQQTMDIKVFNMSDPIPSEKSREGSNMADQARAAGNVWDTMHDRDFNQQKSLKK